MKFLYLCFRCYVWLFAVLGTIILAPIVFVWGTVAREHELQHRAAERAANHEDLI
jgi:hypothetical protein